MTSPSNNNLSKEKIQQLLAAIGSGPTDNSTQLQASEYNLRQPHHFSRDQLNKLDDFTKKLAKKIAQKFASLCSGDFDATIDSNTQHFTTELQKQALQSEQNDYYLAFGNDQNRLSGLIAIPPQTAVIWINQLLGDTQTENEQKAELSQLEESLLLDIASAIVQAISDSQNSTRFLTDKSITRGILSLNLKGPEELCKLAFTLKKNNSENTQAYILMLCDTIETLIGKTEQTVGKFSQEDSSKAIVENLKKMSISVTTQLASVDLTFEELMSLRTSDILLLDKRIDEPLDLIVEGYPLFKALPAKSSGKFAVVVTETNTA